MQTKTQHSPIDRRTLAIRGGIALALSLVVNGLIVGIITATDAVQSFQPLAFPPVLFLSAVGAVGATIVYGLLQWRSARPNRLFAVITGVVLLLSFVPDVTFLPGRPGATTAGILVLMVMHVTVAGICYAVLTR